MQVQECVCVSLDATVMSVRKYMSVLMQVQKCKNKTIAKIENKT